MAGPRAIGLALDLARMPALARSAATTAVPPDILELMRIAAASPQACSMAEASTGVPAQVLTEAARFYLQHALFHPDADSYRVLGLQPGASREVARRHMRWLLQWLHPDRNSGLDGTYAERVLKAWNEMSSSDRVTPTTRTSNWLPSQSKGASTVKGRVRIAWIRTPLNQSDTIKSNSSSTVTQYILNVAAGFLLALFLWAMAAAPAFGVDIVHYVDAFARSFGIVVSPAESLPNPRLLHPR